MRRKVIEREKAKKRECTCVNGQECVGKRVCVKAKSVKAKREGESERGLFVNVWREGEKREGEKREGERGRESVCVYVCVRKNTLTQDRLRSTGGRDVRTGPYFSGYSIKWPAEEKGQSLLKQASKRRSYPAAQINSHSCAGLP